MKEIDSGRNTKQLLKTQCGTAKYMAPETIIRSGKGYDGEKVDAWECGMVLYALLAGYLPFNGEDDNKVFQSILRGKLKFPSHFSPGAKDLLRGLLEKDPEARLALPDARKHLWFLVDYKGDASPAALSAAAAKKVKPKPTPAPQKPKLAKSFKKSKSRSQLSQRIRNGELKFNTDTTEGEPHISVVPKQNRRKSTVRFPKDSGDLLGEEESSYEHDNDDRSDQPRSNQQNDEILDVEARPTDFHDGNISSEKEVAVAAGISAIALEDRASPPAHPAKNGAKYSPIANAFGVPSLGSLFSGDAQQSGSSKDSALETGMDRMTSPMEKDGEGNIPSKTKKKTPIASMFKSMLSSSTDLQSSAPESDGKLVAQSSWFASSPMSVAASPQRSHQDNLDRMVSEDDGSETKVSSFRFLKRSVKKRTENLETK